MGDDEVAFVLRAGTVRIPLRVVGSDEIRREVTLKLDGNQEEAPVSDDDEFAAFIAHVEKMNARMERHNRRAMRVNLPATLVFAGCAGLVLSRLVDAGDVIGGAVLIIALVANGIAQWWAPMREAEE